MHTFLELVLRPRSNAQYVPTMQDLEAVCLQLVYCLAAFERLGVVHNDLHLNNILIEVLPDEVQFTLCDRSDGAPGDGVPQVSQFHLPPTRWMCKIIDWDMATINGSMPAHAKAPANTALSSHKYYPPDACKQANLCGQPGRDLAMVAYNVWFRLRELGQTGPGEAYNNTNLRVEALREYNAMDQLAVARRWWCALVPELEPFLETDRQSLVHEGHPCLRNGTGDCVPVTPTPSAVSVLHRHMAKAESPIGTRSAPMAPRPSCWPA